ncbi:MAG TPA: asparagine synthase (glutamine-hydrolyzing) [Acidobacteriaceae bacterium]|nr:asparagine synthase (glutamine-hydrolyzing) [Acidobacteriaceae bacterium]
MCGIAGLLCLKNSTQVDVPIVLAGMSATMESRGPDASGQWIGPDDRMGFAHRRLSIIDLDVRADQPMHSGDGRYTIVFNGEIYNYQELREELKAKGRRFRTTSDTEVLLAMYAECGAAMLNRLRGMYAFAIWDQEAEELFLARDPFGIKPLYYAEGGGRFYFASQVRALIGVPDVDLQDEPAGHVGFFVWGSVPEPYTLYRGIRCMPSGTWMRASGHGISPPKRFASPVDEALQFDAGAMPTSQEEANVILHDALRESLRMHEIADVPVAIFLSAGIDSGIIASLAGESGNDVEALTLGFDRLRGTAEDETDDAAEVAGHYGLPHYTRFVDQSIFAEHRDRLLEQMDQPTVDGVNTYFISWLARERGFKVALSGLGGDELFGGYPSFHQIPKLVKGLRPLRRTPWVGRGVRVVTQGMISRFTSPKYASLFEYGGSWGGAYLLRRGLFMPWELPGFLDADLVREGWRKLGAIEEMNALVQPFGNLRNVAKEQADFLRVSALETRYYMRRQLLRDADWAGMAHSVEIRVPLVDMVLLRQISALRASRFSPRKPGMVQCLRKPLPAKILNRPKSGFVVPVREWLETGELDSGGAKAGGHFSDRGLRSWAAHVHRVLTRRSGFLSGSAQTSSGLVETSMVIGKPGSRGR